MNRFPYMLCAAALILTLFFAASLRPSAARVAEPPEDAQPPSQAIDAVLFSGVRESDVTRLDITSEETTYRFSSISERRVSLNGRKADADVFSTLLSQILQLPVTPAGPFTPDGQAALTLTLSLKDAQHIVSFYRSADSDTPYVSLISEGSTSPAYHRTDAWRIGAMLLTCEGTRIQDARGRETPMD